MSNDQSSETKEYFGEDILDDYPDMRAMHDIEEYVFNISVSSIPSAVKLIKDVVDANEMRIIYLMIMRAAITRPHCWRLLGTLWKELGEMERSIETSPFTEYLVKRKIIPKSKLYMEPKMIHLSVEEFESHYTLGTLPCAVFYDDVDKVVQFSLIPSFDKETYSADKRRVSLISLAAFYGSIKVFRYLMINDHQITKETTECAIKGGNEDILELMMNKEISFAGMLNIAIHFHRHDIAQWIISNFGFEQVHLTECISSFNTLGFVFFYINGADVNEQVNGYIPIIMAAESGRIEICRFLIQHGANINAANLYGDIALTRAVNNMHLNVLSLLFDNGAEVEYRASNGKTLLHQAAENDRVPLCEFLLQKGADIEAKDNDQSTPLMLAAANGSLGTLQFLIEKGADKEVKNKYAYTALVWAVENDKKDVVKYLLEIGCEPQYTSEIQPLSKAKNEEMEEIIKQYIK